MNKTEFLQKLRASYARNVEISEAKNADYAGSEDPFKNFRVVEFVTGGRISAADGILIRMTDKVQRVANLLTAPNQVADEKIGDTLADLANYAMILKVFLEDEHAS